MSIPKNVQENYFVPEVLGNSELIQYLRNKRTGGRNFQKGSNYESKFALGKIAKLVGQYLSNGLDAKIESQKPDYFVDDLVVEYPDNSVEAFQLKNVQELSWGPGNKGDLSFDFYQQIVKASGTNTSLALVVSSEAVAAKLKMKKPDALKDCVVEHFPEAPFRVLVCGPLRESLSELAKSPKPPTDMLVQIGKLLQAEWWVKEGNAFVSELIPAAGLPKLLKSERNQEDIEAQLGFEVREILEAIPDFSFSLARGFFHCSYLQTEISLGFDCFHPKFEKFQKWILEHRPTEFEGDFEDMVTAGSDGYE
jgi:hypothetical protein